MDCKKEVKIDGFLPFGTILVLMVSVLSYLSPDVASLLVYDRLAVMNGQWWRLVTSHVVHFDRLHLVYDLIAFGLIGWILEARLCRYFYFLCALLAFSIGIALFIMKPGMMRYGGLSGLACGLFIYLALIDLYHSKLLRIPCWIVIGAVSIKIIFEGCTGQSIFPYSKQAFFVSMWEAHAIGSLMAIWIFFAGRVVKRKILNVNGRSNSALTGQGRQTAQVKVIPAP